MVPAMIDAIQEDIVRYMYRVNIVTQPDDHLQQACAAHGDEDTATRQPVVRKDHVGRNDPCPCGSGKKYKKCCGR